MAAHAVLALLLLAGIQPPEEAVVVFRTGKTLVVRSWKSDGKLVRIVALDGTPQVLRASLVDLGRSERETAGHQARLARDAGREQARIDARAERREETRDANQAHRARSSGKPAMTVGWGDAAQVVEEHRPTRAESLDRLRVELEAIDRTLLFFVAERCAECKRMATDVLTQPAVLRALDGYDLKEVDVDRQEAVARKYGIDRVPAFVVLDPADKVVKASAGFLPPGAFAEWLRR